jgi:hypothetical protein
MSLRLTSVEYAAEWDRAVKAAGLLRREHDSFTEYPIIAKHASLRLLKYVVEYDGVIWTEGWFVACQEELAERILLGVIY